MFEQFKSFTQKPYAWPTLGWILSLIVLAGKGTNVDMAMFAVPLISLIFIAVEWLLRNNDRFSDLRFRSLFQKACVALPLALLVAIGIQNQITLHQVDEHLQKGEFDQATQILSDRINVAFHSEMALRLARIYATTPQLKNRNYEKSIEISERLMSWKDPVISRLAADTYACALFASRRENEAKLFAETQGLTRRLERFKVGRPCGIGGGLTLYTRDVASRD